MVVVVVALEVSGDGQNALVGKVKRRINPGGCDGRQSGQAQPVQEKVKFSGHGQGG